MMRPCSVRLVRSPPPSPPAARRRAAAARAARRAAAACGRRSRGHGGEEDAAAWPGFRWGICGENVENMDGKYGNIWENDGKQQGKWVEHAGKWMIL